MNTPPTIQQIDNLSNLIAACRMTGASYKTEPDPRIVMPDGTVYLVIETLHLWRFVTRLDDAGTQRCFSASKRASTQKLHVRLLSMQLEVIKL